MLDYSRSVIRSGVILSAPTLSASLRAPRCRDLPCQAVPTPTCGENLHCTYCICPRWEVDDFAANAPLTLQRYESFARGDVDPVMAWALTALCEDIRATCPNIDELKDSCRLEHVANTFHDVGLYCALR